MQGEASPVASAPGYTAFISYRHVEPDRAWAQWLHTALETYRVPRRLARERGLPRRPGRVFRDEEELPASADLSREIDAALQASRFLIVVCSPRTPSSRWVNREVERFREMGRDDRILALLVEGSPSDSFPRALREIRRRRDDASDAGQQSVSEVEPLAADARPVEWERPAQTKRIAKLRLLAQILGVSYDDLRRREAERRARRRQLLTLAFTLLFAVLAGLSGVAWTQRHVAIAQRELAERRGEDAERARQAAEARRVDAEQRLAESLIARGNLEGTAGRWAAARPLYYQARQTLVGIGQPTFAADVAEWDALRRAAIPVNRFAGGTGDAAADEAARAELHALSEIARRALRTNPATSQPSSRPVSVGVGRHLSGITAMAFSPDGRTLFTASADHTVKCWDVMTGRELRAFRGHRGSVDGLALSADGKRLLSCGSDRTLRLWDADTGAEVARMDGHTNRVIRLGFSDDGRVAVSASWDMTVRVWDVAAARESRRFDAALEPNNLALSPDGRLLAAPLSQHASLTDLSAAPGAAPPPRPVRARGGRGAGPMTFSADGRFLLSVGNGDAIEVRGVTDDRLVAEFTGHANRVRSAATTRSGLAVTGSWDQTARVWHVESGQEVARFDSHEPIDAVAVSPAGDLVASAGPSGEVCLWRVGLRDTGILSGGRFASVSSDGRLAVSEDGGSAGLKLCDTATGQVVAATPHRGPGVFVPGGYSILLFAQSSALDGLTLLELKPGGVAPVSQGKGTSGKFLGISGTAAAMLGAKNEIHVIDLPSLRLRRTYAAQRQYMFAARFASGGRRIVSVGNARQVVVTDLVDGTNVTVLDGHRAEIQALELTPDGARAVSGAADGEVKLWDLGGGREIASLTRHAAGVQHLAVSYDGMWVASAGMEGAVHLSSAVSGAPVRVLPARAADVGGIQLLTFKPDGTLLVSRGEKTEVCDFARPQRLRQLESTLREARDRLGVSPQDARALSAYGKWYAEIGMTDWAISCLSSAAETGDGADVAELTLARLYWSTGDRANAQAAFERALRRAEAPREYLLLCLGALADAETTAPANSN